MPCPAALCPCHWPENATRSDGLGAMPELGREGEVPTEMRGVTWGISQGWEPAGLAGTCAMLVSMETQQKMCFHRGAASEEQPVRQGGRRGPL